MSFLKKRKRLWEILEREMRMIVSVYTDIFLITLIILNITAVLLKLLIVYTLFISLNFLVFERISTFIFFNRIFAKSLGFCRKYEKKKTSKFMTRVNICVLGLL